MTTKTTTAKTPAWLRYSRDVDAQCAANTTPAQVAAAYEAYLNGTQARTINGAPSYRDAGSSDRYEVGYGGERRYATRPATKAIEPASDKQKAFIDDLLIKRVHINMTDDVIDSIKANKAQASRFISFLLAQPKVADQAPAPLKVEVLTEVAAPTSTRLNFAEILDGNYAVREDSVVKFYRVSTNRKGYKNVQVRASDNLFMLFGKASIAVLHRIVEAGLAESRMLFVTELGRCCKCGRSLTDEVSRSNALENGGYGPDCVGM